MLASGFSAVALAWYIVLSAYILRHDVKHKPNRMFVLYLIAMAVWQFTALMAILSENAASALLWYRLMAAGLVGQCIFYSFFALSFVRARGLGEFMSAGWVVLVAMVALTATDMSITGVEKHPAVDLYIPRFGVLVPLYGVVAYAFFGYGVHALLRGYQRTTSHMERARFKCLLIGAIVTAMGGLANFILPLHAYPITVAANLINVILIMYAILRYRLLDLTFVVRRVVAYAILILSITAGYLVAFIATERLLAVGSSLAIVAILGGAAILAVTMPVLRDVVQGWVDRLLFHGRYDLGRMLEDLSQDATSVLELDTLARLLLDEIVARMQAANACLLLRDQDTGEFYPVAYRGLGEEGNALRFSAEHPLIEWLSRSGRVISRKELESLPQMRGLWEEERKELERLGFALYIPLLLRERLIGLLAVGPRISGRRYSAEDRMVLRTLANQMAISVEKARFYEQAVEEKRKAEIILEETFSGLIVVDTNLTIVAMNAGAEEITGYRRDEVLGKRLTDVFDAEVWGEDSLLERAIRTRERVPPEETRIGGRDGPRDVLAGVTPLRDGSGRIYGYLLSFTDITRLKEVDRLKSDIVANVSHELRAPLASIKAYTELLLDNVEGEDRTLRQQFLDVINQETDRLSALISDLLDLSRLESGRAEVKKEKLNLEEVISEAVALFERQAADRNIDVRIDIAPEAKSVIADRDMLFTIVKNLISNAVKFSRDGGLVEITGSMQGDTFIMTVEDHGVGIPAEALPHLFQKFYRVRSTAESGIEGTGLGLVLVKEAVKALGGDITVESEVGVGTRFTVSLPQTEQA